MSKPNTKDHDRPVMEEHAQRVAIMDAANKRVIVKRKAAKLAAHAPAMRTMLNRIGLIHCYNLPNPYRVNHMPGYTLWHELRDLLDKIGV